jgi:hypothetical protein
MSRKEVVLLVSHALAVMQFSYAMIEITYLPVRFMSFFHHASRASVLDPPAAYDLFYRTYYGVDIAFFLVRIVFLLTLAVIFWNCGPWVERVLLPKHEEPDQAA